MDGSQFDAMAKRVTESRRALVGGSLAALAGALSLREAGARKKRRKKKCKTPKVKCGKQCLPAGACCTNAECGTCQTCSGNACVVAPAGSACGVGGRCNGTACIGEGTFGCTTNDDFCAGENVPCPTSTTPNARCFEGGGNVVCGTGDCFIVETDADCEQELGPGAKRVPCASCTLLSPPPGWAACVIPVTQ
ncbi:MAG: hypothetical protein QM692_14980 [Thermomicrobiales bacterium]